LEHSIEKYQMNNWKNLSVPFNPTIHEAVIQQHHATQFLAMATNVFVPEKEDDQHNSLSFESTLNSLITDPFDVENALRLGLRLTDLSILFIDREGHVKCMLELDNKSKAEAFDAFRRSLGEYDLPVEKITDDLHYSIPKHSLDNGGRFSIKDQPALYENVVYRHNADLVLNRITNRYKSAMKTRVWPHHFDSGGLIPLGFDDQDELTKSIGIGFAIPDSMVGEPYFYLKYWSADPTEKLEEMTPFSSNGTWKTPDFQGAVLPISDLIEYQDPSDQYGAVNRFFDEGISRIISAKNKI
jgi:hypothetical protein